MTTQAEQMKKLDQLAVLLDSAITIPGTKWKIGLDGIMGLIPGIGDLAAGASSTYILFHALKMGVPVPVLLRMGINILLESVIGTIPLVGDLFDFAFKANIRNVNLMRSYVLNPVGVKRRSSLVIGAIIVGLIAILMLLVWGMWRLVRLMFSAF